MNNNTFLVELHNLKMIYEEDQNDKYSGLIDENPEVVFRKNEEQAKWHVPSLNDAKKKVEEKNKKN